jgi:hypothetical protein
VPTRNSVLIPCTAEAAIALLPAGRVLVAAAVRDSVSLSPPSGLAVNYQVPMALTSGATHLEPIPLTAMVT